MTAVKRNNGRIVVSERFRTPSPLERAMGFWLDRVGAGVAVNGGEAPPPFRKLGLFAAVCVTRGEGVFHSIPFGEAEVAAGDVMLLFPDVPAAYYPNRKWETEWIVWGGKEANVLADSGLLSAQRPVVCGKGGIVSDTRAKLLAILADETASAVLSRKIAVLDMIRELATKPPAVADSASAVVGKAVAYVERHISAAPSVGEVASHRGYSETHFRRVFAKAAGISPKHFIINRMISLAKECLANGGTVKEAVDAGGFGSEPYFRSAFKRLTGTTPGEFQKSLMRRG